MRRLHLAVHVPLQKRCHEDFAAMPAVAGGRRCASCQTTVHDLSAMTRGEASRFVAARAGEPTCYRYLVNGDGTLVFAPEPVHAALSAVVALSLAACAPSSPPQPPGTELPGDIAAAHDAPVIPHARADVDPIDMPVADTGSSAVRYPRAPVERPVYRRPPPPKPAPEPGPAGLQDYRKEIMGARLW